MAKRPTRLRFTEDDLSSDAVKKAAGKAEKAAAKAEKAVDKITPKKHRKLRQEADVSASRTAKLRFGKAKADDIPPKPSGIKRTVTHAPVDTLSANVHKSISRYEDDNVGVQTAHQTELGAETAYHIADQFIWHFCLHWNYQYHGIERREMKVLFVEDENVKQSNIVTYLKDELGVENISVVNSLMGGMLALRNGKFDIVLLDMSLPLYDINGEDEELNEFEAFGGIEILDEIDRKELSVKVLVITAFDVIEDDTKKINLEQLDDQMKEN